jgi:hypothetical protein
MAVLASGAVSRWRELATDELRDRVQQLVAARLDAEHAVWKTIRRDPVLTARVRGVLSGMASSVSGTRDEHMRKVWIAAARTALEADRANPSVARPARATPEQVVPFEAPEPPMEANGVSAHVDSEQASDTAGSPAETAADEHVQVSFTSVPPPVVPVSASPRAPIPPMVFSGP